MSDIQIRPLLHDDQAQWRELWAAYNAFYGREGADALPCDVVDATWSRLFNPTEPVHALVAEQQGVLLGLAHFLFHRSTILIEPTCYLQDLYTVEQARGTGIGRALIESVCDRARAAGATRVYWQTHETNAAAMRLYDKVAERTGFVVYRTML